MKYIIAVFLILFASFADIFLVRMGYVPGTPSTFLLPLFMVLCFLRYSIKDYIQVFKTHTFKLLALILFLSCVYSAFTSASSTVIIEKISLNLITLILYVFATHFFKVEKTSLVLFVMIGGLVVLGGSLLYDFFYGLPGQSVRLTESVRKGGFGENPNQAASGIKFLALGALVFLTEMKRLKYLVIVFMVLTVFLSFSRSGLASIFLILALGSINNWHYQFQQSGSVIVQRVFKLVLLFTVLFVSLIALATVIKANFPQFTRGEAGKRIDLLTGQTESNNISSAAIEGGRAELFVHYLDEFMKNPLGYGTGYSSDKLANGGKLNTHNYYLYLAVNLGLLAFVMFLVYVIYNLILAFRHNQYYYLIFGMLFIVEGFVTHNLFYERSIIICLALFDSQIYKQLESSSMAEV